MIESMPDNRLHGFISLNGMRNIELEKTMMLTSTKRFCRHYIDKCLLNLLAMNRLHPSKSACFTNKIHSITELNLYQHLMFSFTIASVFLTCDLQRKHLKKLRIH